MLILDEKGNRKHRVPALVADAYPLLRTVVVLHFCFCDVAQHMKRFGARVLHCRHFRSLRVRDDAVAIVKIEIIEGHVR